MGAIPHGYERGQMSEPGETLDTRTWDEIVGAASGATHTESGYRIEYLANAYAVKYADGTYQAIMIDSRYVDRKKIADPEIARFLLASPRRRYVTGEWVEFTPVVAVIEVDPDGTTRPVRFVLGK